MEMTVRVIGMVISRYHLLRPATAAPRDDEIRRRILAHDFHGTRNSPHLRRRPRPRALPGPRRSRRRPTAHLPRQPRRHPGAAPGDRPHHRVLHPLEREPGQRARRVAALGRDRGPRAPGDGGLLRRRLAARGGARRQHDLAHVRVVALARASAERRATRSCSRASSTTPTCARGRSWRRSAGWS